MQVILSNEICGWLEERIEDLLSDYRSDITREIERVQEALDRIGETSEQLLQEVVIDGELTVPGAAVKLSTRLRGLEGEFQVPQEITYSSVQTMIGTLEGVLHDSMVAGRRYVPRLPKFHKKIIKELDYHIRTIDNAHQKMRKVSEKNRLPRELEKITEQAEELEQKSHQLVELVGQLKILREEQEKTAGRVEKQQEGIAQFREESGLAEIEQIRRDIDAIRMLVTNQLNFLKKPFKKLSQVAGEAVILSSTASEGADRYSVDTWQAFQGDLDQLSKLKAGLTALDDAVQTKKLKVKASVHRKISDRRTAICENHSLDELHLRYTNLVTRQQQLQSSISTEERRELEKTLERAEWEHRDIKAEIAHSEEQITRLTSTIKALVKKLERALTRLIRDEVTIEVPEEVQALLEEEGKSEKS